MDSKNKAEASQTPESVRSEHEVRVAKVSALREQNIEPWPAYKPVGATTKDVLAAFDADKDESKEYTVAGRIVAVREHGKTIFSHIQDRSGKIQLYLKFDILGEELFTLFKKYIDIGDIIWVRGSAFVTKMGETTIRVEEFTLLSKCLFPLPEKFHGLADVEGRYRQRYLDLISNEQSREKFAKRSHIIQAIRSFLLEKDFLEVETPMLHPIPGGAAARPFVTHHNAYHMKLFLRIAPELYLKRLVVGGFERVFEINRNFRNEGVSTKHNPEFTMLEFYMAHADYHVGMDFTEQLFAHVIQENFSSPKLPFKDTTLDFTTPFKRMTLEESLHEVGGFSYEQLDQKNIDTIFTSSDIKMPSKNPSYGAKLFALFEEVVESKLIQPTFITGHPVEVSPLAKRDLENPYTVARFELFAGGIELANGFSELNEPFDQAERFKKQAQRSEEGDVEAMHFDADYVHALEYGLPPTVGVGIGIDRLVMMLTDTQSIKDVILFPTLKSVTSESSDNK